MQRILAFTLALLASATAASAAADPLGVAVVIAPLEGPVPPLTGFAETTVTATISCALIANAAPGQPAQLKFAVKESPAWTMVTVAPELAQISHGQCDPSTQTAVATTRMTIYSLPEGPAFSPEPAVVTATLEGPAGKQVGEGNVSIESDWMSLIELFVDTTFATLEPGKSATFTITLRDRGNAPVVVEGRLENATGPWNVTGPGSVSLDLGQPGTATIVVTAPTEAVREPGAFTFEFVSKLASDPAREGDSTRVTLIVSVKGNSPIDVAKGVPGPPGGLLSFGAALAALAGRRAVK